MKIKPFCVKSEDLTDEELNQMLEACLDYGVEKFDWVRGYYDAYPSEMIKKDHCLYWGVDEGGKTYTHSDLYTYDNNLLSKEEAFDMLKGKVYEN